RPGPPRGGGGVGGGGAGRVSGRPSRCLRGAGQPGRLGSLTLPRVGVLSGGGNRLYVGAENQVFAVDLPLGEGKSTVSWAAPINGRPAHIVAGGGRPYVRPRQGRGYCFRRDQAKAPPDPLPAP